MSKKTHLFSLFSIPDGVFLETGRTVAKRAIERRDEQYFNSHNIAVIEHTADLYYVGEINSWARRTTKPKADIDEVKEALALLAGRKSNGN